MGAPERRIVHLLLQHAEQRKSRDPQMPRATVKWVAAQLGQSVGTVHRVLKRLGISKIVVNLGFGNRLDLAVSMVIEDWNLELLERLRGLQKTRLECDGAIE